MCVMAKGEVRTMNIQALETDGGLVPRFVKPADGPLPLYRFLFDFIQNPLRVVPERAYHDAMTVRRRRGGGKAAWITDPVLIEDILIKAAVPIAKSEFEKRILGKTLGDGVLTSDGASWRW